MEGFCRRFSGGLVEGFCRRFSGRVLSKVLSRASELRLYFLHHGFFFKKMCIKFSRFTGPRAFPAEGTSQSEALGLLCDGRYPLQGGYLRFDRNVIKT